MKMRNTSFTDERKALCVLWMGAGLGGTAFKRSFSTKYHITAPLKHTIILPTKVIATEKWFKPP